MAPDHDGGPITVVIADDHAVIRAALRMLLDAEPGIEVVAEAGDAPEAIRRVDEYGPECWCWT